MIRDTNIFLRTYFQVLNAFAMSLPGAALLVRPHCAATPPQVKTCSLLHTETVFEHCSCTSRTSAQTTLLT